MKNAPVKLRSLLPAVLIAALAGVCACTARNAAREEAVAAEKKPAAGSEKVFTCTSAGRWFPDDPAQLRELVDGHLAAAEKKNLGKGSLVALVSPHAGLQISGPVAAFAYKQLEGASFDTVVVVGFSHSTFAPGIGVFPSGVFRTPLGDIPVDEKTVAELAAASDRISASENLFYGEHSLDNQLPYLQRTLKSFRLAPVLFGSQTDENIEALAGALAKVLRGRNALLVASTDMSHYWMYDEANMLDAGMIELIKKFDAEGIRNRMKGDAGGRQMCGHGAVSAVLLAARALGADRVEVLRHANSQDTYGGGERGVVGYLAAALVDGDNSGAVEEAGPRTDTDLEKNEEEAKAMAGEGAGGDLNGESRKELLRIARNSLETYIKTGKKIRVETENPELQVKRRMFVTLEKKGNLRGCMGHLENDTPIGKLAASQVLVSALDDTRFPDVKPEELKDITIEISVLSVLAPVDSYKDIVVGKHGVILQKHGQGATFLPQVAPEQGWDRDTMLTHLAAKAGLAPDAWKEGASFLVYTAEVFGEE